LGSGGDFFGGVGALSITSNFKLSTDILDSNLAPKIRKPPALNKIIEDSPKLHNQPNSMD
jgi:hypothetical protein